jgi:hypothetical protein
MNDPHACFPGTTMWPMCPTFCPSWVRWCSIRAVRDAQPPHEWPPRRRAFHGGRVPPDYEPIPVGAQEYRPEIEVMGITVKVDPAMPPNRIEIRDPTTGEVRAYWGEHGVFEVIPPRWP